MKTKNTVPPPSSWSLYVVTDVALSKGRPHDEIAGKAFAGGADAVQLRDKKMTGRELLSSAKRVLAIARGHGGAFIVNDRIDVAMASSAHGVHLGFSDFDFSLAKELLPSSMLLGITVTSLEEARHAIAASPDYIAISPVFEARESKWDAGPPVGLKFVEKVRSMTEIPLIGIGGIHHENAHSVIKAGACAVAVISAVVSAKDMEGSARRLKEIVQEVKGKQLHPS